MHERQAIRDAVVAALRNETAAGDRVYKSRQEPIRSTELPAINVFSVDDTTDEESSSSAPRDLFRTNTLQVVGWVSAASPTSGPETFVDDRMDGLALEIETALDADVTFDDTASDSYVTATEFAESAAGERPMGAVVLTLSVKYRTGLRVPAPSEPLNTIDARTSINGAQDEADQLHDRVTGLNPSGGN